MALRREMERPARLLGFAGDMEARFETDTGRARERHLIRTGVFAIVLGNLFLLAEPSLIRDVMADALIYHLAICTPLYSCVILYTACHPPPRRREAFHAVSLGLILLGAVGLFWISRAPASGYLCASFAMFIVFTTIVLRLRFAWCLAFNAVAVLPAMAAALLRGGMPPGVPMVMMMTTGITAAYTMQAAYSIENGERRAYLMKVSQDLDARELAETNATLNRLSTTDALTGVANRRAFDTRLTRAWLGGRQAVALIMVDVDHFKSFNDCHGHLAGDRCLADVAGLLGQYLRKMDLLARYGGEEFAVILPDTDLPLTQRIAERMRSAVEDAAILHGGVGAGQLVTISVGVAMADTGQGITQEALINAADGALYLSKHGGRNRVRIAAASGPTEPFDRCREVPADPNPTDARKT